jgi:excinuclease ABC subunit B
MDKTHARRLAQIEHNKKYDIIPQTIIKSISEKKREIKGALHFSKIDIEKKLIEMDSQMRKYAEQLDFEKAIELRDAIDSLKSDYASIQNRNEYKDKQKIEKKQKNAELKKTKVTKKRIVK